MIDGLLVDRSYDSLLPLLLMADGAPNEQGAVVGQLMINLEVVVVLQITNAIIFGDLQVMTALPRAS